MKTAKQCAQLEEAPELDDWLNTAGLVFRVASIKKDMAGILRCRAAGLGRYGRMNPEDWADPRDADAAHYVCQREDTGEIVGCMRMLPSDRGPLEVQEFIDLSLWLRKGVLAGEFSLLSVLRTAGVRRQAVRLGLLTLGHRDALRRGHARQIAWPVPGMQPFFDMLFYAPYPGEPNRFTHARLGNREHLVMGMEVPGAAERYREACHPFHEFMHERDHPNMVLD